MTLWFDKFFEHLTNANREKRIEEIRRKKAIAENKSAIDDQFESTKENIRRLETKLDQTVRSIKAGSDDVA